MRVVQRRIQREIKLVISRATSREIARGIERGIKHGIRRGIKQGTKRGVKWGGRGQAPGGRTSACARGLGVRHSSYNSTRGPVAGTQNQQHYFSEQHWSRSLAPRPLVAIEQQTIKNVGGSLVHKTYLPSEPLLGAQQGAR